MGRDTAAARFRIQIGKGIPYVRPKEIYKRPCGPCPSMLGTDEESEDIKAQCAAGNWDARDWVFPCAWRQRKICYGIAKELGVTEDDLKGYQNGQE